MAKLRLSQPGRALFALPRFAASYAPATENYTNYPMLFTNTHDFYPLNRRKRRLRSFHQKASVLSVLSCKNVFSPFAQKQGAWYATTAIG